MMIKWIRSVQQITITSIEHAWDMCCFQEVHQVKKKKFESGEQRRIHKILLWSFKPFVHLSISFLPWAFSSWLTSHSFTIFQIFQTRTEKTLFMVKFCWSLHLNEKKSSPQNDATDVKDDGDEKKGCWLAQADNEL